MQERDVKIALENYHYFLSSIESTQWKLDELNCRRFKSGGSIAKAPENPVDRQTVMIDNLAKLEELTKAMDFYQHNVHLAQAFMSTLRDGDHKDLSMCRDKFIRRKSVEWISMNYCMDRKTVWRRINYLICAFISQT